MISDASIFPPVISIGDLYRDPKRAPFWYDHTSARLPCCIVSIVAANSDGELRKGVPHPCACGATWAQVKSGQWRIEGAAARPERSKPRTQTLGQLARAKTAKRGTR